jgi:hypothetical protein
MMMTESLRTEELMQGTREQFDADRIGDRPTYSRIRNGNFQHNLNCSICNQSLYVDKEHYEKVVRSIKEGLDNPFLCEECQEEHTELEHS